MIHTRAMRKKPFAIHVQDIVVSLIALFVLLVAVYPLVYTIINSLKSYEQFVSTPQYSLPDQVFLGNYTRVVQSKFHLYFINSIIVASLVVVFTVLLSCTSAFAISKLKFRGQRHVEVLFLLGLMIPYQVVLIPLFLTYSKLDMLNTYWSLVLPQVAFGMPFSVQLFIAFFKDFDNDMLEAAVIDGCSIGAAFVRIILPMCRNIMIAIATVRAIFSWNEYLFSYTFINTKKMMTIVLGLNSFVGEEGLVDWGPTFAAITVTVLPTLVVYMFLAKYMQSGLAEGSVKG